ncbi:virulence factor [Mycolicibacterium moriokaense]|uniref:Virulence factor n=2 Tax=Mycolicibacterium moriokaense TaxID=39691 RepID=A0AAD1HHH6_9MYCO|nr:MCE family protein [Mycolicibacterium moriokaense]MCV7042125.1 MCE family protein [Mycolicibacterium moriokaense]BBX04895.1 virulence factor [Mycolicibacterium moriokaense]
MKRAAWSAATSARPVAAEPGKDFGSRSYVRPLAGLIAVVVAVIVVMVTIALFNGRFIDSVPVTVMADRAGLLMDPGAKVKLHGAQVGTVSAVKETPDGQAELRLAMDPERLKIVPSNVEVEIANTTVFGAKSVDLLPPADPSATPLRAGQVINSRHVTVEANTIFQDLESFLSHIDPVKLNETLGAIATAMSGRGEAFGRSLTDFNQFLGTIEPSLPQLGDEIAMFADVANSYADSAPALLDTLSNATQISTTLIDQESSLDRILFSTIGLADTGQDVIGSNSDALADWQRLLVPTTDLIYEYREALDCSLAGIYDNYVLKPPGPNPGVTDVGALALGIERYRYPGDLPKVAASGPPQCKGQLPLQFNSWPPKVVADIGTNPYKYGNVGPLVNSDLLKEILYGPLDGPPRNSAQMGMPG